MSETLREAREESESHLNELMEIIELCPPLHGGTAIDGVRLALAAPKGDEPPVWEFVRECAKPPYHDSDLESLLTWVRSRAAALLDGEMHPASSVNEQRMNAAFTFFRRIMILGEMGDAEFKEHLNTAVTTLWLHNTPDKDRELASEFFYRAHHAETVVEAVREGEDAVKALEHYDKAMVSRAAESERSAVRAALKDADFSDCPCPDIIGACHEHTIEIVVAALTPKESSDV